MLNSINLVIKHMKGFFSFLLHINTNCKSIDFQMCGVVDPYLVLTGAGVSAMYSVPFAKGQIDEYFGKDVPDDFWEK